MWVMSTFSFCKEVPLIPSSWIYFSFLHPLLPWQIICPASCWTLALSISLVWNPSHSCLCGEGHDGSHFSLQAPSISSPATFVWFLFFHSKNTPPSIFLFFLNVIVKCSSEMTLNMCILTEGIHLVIYFLLPESCHLFVSSFMTLTAPSED